MVTVAYTATELRLYRRQSVGSGAAAIGMAPARRTSPGSPGGIRNDVEYDVVRAVWITGDSRHAEQMIETEKLPNSPGDIVIRAGGIAAHSDAADKNLSGRIQADAATEDVYPADLQTNHRVLVRTVPRGRSFVGGISVDWVAVGQCEQTAARLNG